MVFGFDELLEFELVFLQKQILARSAIFYKLYLFLKMFCSKCYCWNSATEDIIIIHRIKYGWTVESSFSWLAIA